METFINLVVGGVCLAGRIIDAAIETVTEDETSVDYWLKKGYFVVCRRVLEIEVFNGVKYEDEVMQFIAAYPSYKEAKREAGWFYEVVCPN